MPTRCAIILQSFEFTVVHKLGNLDMIPYVLPRLSVFE